MYMCYAYNTLQKIMFCFYECVTVSSVCRKKIKLILKLCTWETCEDVQVVVNIKGMELTVNPKNSRTMFSVFGIKGMLMYI